MVEKDSSSQLETVYGEVDFESIATRYFNTLDANEVHDTSYRDSFKSENTDWVFFEQTHNHLVLSKEETKELFLVIHQGEDSHKEMLSGNGNLTSEDKEAFRNEIQIANLARAIVIYGHIHLVTKIASKYAFNSQLPLSDLLQEGTLGLMEAIKKYDISRNNKFSTYAYWYAKRNIINAILTQTKIIKIPIDQVSKVNKYNKENAQLRNDLGRTPTKQEIAQKMEITEKKLEKILQGIHGVASLDELLENGQFPTDNSHCDIETEISEKEERDKIKEIAYTLPYKFRIVVFLRFGFYDNEFKTFKQISQSLGISRSCCENRYKKAVEQIKTEYNKLEY